ncbi:MAG: hypothetical protein RMY28_012615 [Nostoc sp. ChiSLP01]|nr:hypothetical protein [Nostoc sp. ChiSLP01]
MEFLIYLDVCRLNRPISNQTQEPITLQAQRRRLILIGFQTCDVPKTQLQGISSF